MSEGRTNRNEGAIATYAALTEESRKWIVERCASLPGGLRRGLCHSSLNPHEVFGRPVLTSGFFTKLVKQAASKERKVQKAVDFLLSPQAQAKACQKARLRRLNKKKKAGGKRRPNLIYTPMLGQPRNKRGTTN
jgi:hypothetical protein